MHGSDKPVVGDLVFDTDLDDKKVEGEDHEMAIEVTDDEDNAADTDEPGMFCYCRSLETFYIFTQRKLRLENRVEPNPGKRLVSRR